MPSFPQSLFPTIETVMDLARSIVNDMFPGINGANGRILTDNASFTLPFLNSSFRTLQRKLRLEGVTFEIKDNVILFNLTPVVVPDPAVQTFVSFTGYFDGTQMHPTPFLPPDCLQVYKVWERITNSGNPFVELTQPREGLPSVFQSAKLGQYEIRNYAINMVGSTLAQDLRIRYKSGQPPLNVPVSSFATTKINIIDSEDALAYMLASKYVLSRRRGADVSALDALAADAISDMAEEFVRRQQTVRYTRIPYGQTSVEDNQSPLGSTNFNN